MYTCIYIYIHTYIQKGRSFVQVNLLSKPRQASTNGTTGPRVSTPEMK